MSTAIQHHGILKSNDSNNPKHPVNIHSNPSVNASVITTLSPGTSVEIIDQNQPGDGHTWYKVVYTDNHVGWVRNDVIQILPDQNLSDTDTRLYFETDQRQVRVFGKNQPCMNVYNKKNDVTEVAQVPASKVPNSDDQWQSYIAKQDGRTYQAKFIPRDQTELVISDSNDGHIIETESGFGANGSDYRG